MRRPLNASTSLRKSAGRMSAGGTYHERQEADRCRPDRVGVHGQGPCAGLHDGGPGLRPAVRRRSRRAGRRQCRDLPTRPAGTLGFPPFDRGLARPADRSGHRHRRYHHAQHAAPRDGAGGASRPASIVYCEKPLAPTAAEAWRWRKPPRRARVATQVGFNYLKNPMMALAQQIIASRRDRRDPHVPRHPCRGLYGGRTGALDLAARPGGRRRRARRPRQPYPRHRPLPGRADRRAHGATCRRRSAARPVAPGAIETTRRGRSTTWHACW